MNAAQRLAAVFPMPVIALHPGALDGIDAQLRLYADGRLPAAARRPTTTQRASRRVAAIGIHGPLTNRGSFIGDIFGWSNYADIGAEVSQAIADDTIDEIVLDIDSPGGDVAGCQELATLIASSPKPVTAFACGICASAAYWLASQATRIIAMPSSQVGSIGVICVHADFSEANAKDGISVTYFVTSVFKAEGNPDEPMTDPAAEYLMTQLGAYHDEFVGAVARGRGVTRSTVESSFGQGRAMVASQARSAGMVDDLQDNLQAALASKVVGARARVRAGAEERHRILAAATRELAREGVR